MSVSIFYDNVILQVLTKHLTMVEIIRMASTCRQMHNKWINKTGLKLKDHLLSFFKWKTPKISAFTLFRKHIFASLNRGGPCVGGCGTLDVSEYQCVPKAICKYNLCVTCFNRKDTVKYMDKRGYLRAEVVRNYMIGHFRECVSFSADIKTAFFDSGELFDFCTNLFRFKFFRYNDYIKISYEEIDQIVASQLDNVTQMIKTHIQKIYEVAENYMANTEHKLELAKSDFNRKKRMYDEVVNFRPEN